MYSPPPRSPDCSEARRSSLFGNFFIFFPIPTYPSPLKKKYTLSKNTRQAVESDKQTNLDSSSATKKQEDVDLYMHAYAGTLTKGFRSTRFIMIPSIIGSMTG